MKNISVFCKIKCRDCQADKRRKCNIRWALIYTFCGIAGIVLTRYGIGINIPLPDSWVNPAGVLMITENVTGNASLEYLIEADK